MSRKTRCTYKPTRVSKGRIVVTCRLCGPSVVKRPIALARALEDSALGRFETSANRAERLRLAQELRGVAASLARSKRRSA